MTQDDGARGVVRANLSFLGAIAIWGSFFPLMSHLLETWDPYSNAAARAVLGTLVLGALTMARHGVHAFAVRLPWRRVAALAVFGVVGFNLLMTLGIAHSGPISASIVATTGPISAAVLGRILYGRRIRPVLFLAAALAVAGGVSVALARGGGLVDLRGGELLVLAASIAWMWYSMRFGEWLGHVPQTQAATVTYGLGAIVLVLAVAVLGALGVTPLRIDLSAESMGLMVLVAVTSTAAAVLLWLDGVRRIGVTIGAAYGNLVPVVAVATAALFGIVPRPLELLGGLVVIAAVVLAQVGATAAEARTPRPSGD